MMPMLRRTLGLFGFSLLAAAQTAVFPGEDWARWDKPESAGYASARLEALRTWLQSIDTTAMLAVHKGRVLFEYGDVKHVSYLASCRKSVLAMLYGNYVASGKIRLDATLGELGITDHGGLSPREQSATVEHLITARSGVYHPAANDGDDLASAPPRNSQRPGDYTLYSNWDFNAAGAAFEKMTGRDLFDALETDLARPLGMRDFDRARHRKSGDLTKSMHPAYHMHFSTRDMARLGYLMANEGNWNGKQLVPRDWARRITSLVTPLVAMNPPPRRGFGSGFLWGYGYMWWVWDAMGSPGPLRGAYAAHGAAGQFITVIPALELVIAHKTDPAGGKSVSYDEYYAALRLLLAARCRGGACK